MSDSSSLSAVSGDDRLVTGRSITLEGVTKIYRGQKKPAVDAITLEIPAGEVVMLVGPSGCGKTTTLKMINRLVEPTAGRILLGDEDVTDIDSDRLRRRIGYVIQAGGLFPHMTVATNIALVPKMLRWDSDRIEKRVTELLELVSLDPDIYRDRYPKELSGGQQQRVGVARALAADPPVLLMDEPFGAVDPITRQRLQDELIGIQDELKKTMVIVTHDFDEAVKLGDRIVILDQGAHVVQYDTPERILASPANEFVEDFIGAGAGLKQLSLSRVRDFELSEAVTVTSDSSTSDALDRAREAGGQHVVVIDEQHRPVAWLSVRDLGRMSRLPTRADPNLPIVGLGASLNDALDTMLVATVGGALVVNGRGQLAGVIDVETVMRAITQVREAAAAEHETDAPVGTNTDCLEPLSNGESDRE